MLHIQFKTVYEHGMRVVAAEKLSSLKGKNFLKRFVYIGLDEGGFYAQTGTSKG